MIKPPLSISPGFRSRLSARYRVALQAYLAKPRQQAGRRAKLLGHVAQAGGLRTLDLVMIHEEAIVALAPSCDFASRRHGAIRTAGVFFTRALRPMEAAQRAIRDRQRDLLRRTEFLAFGNRRLENEIKRREAGERNVLKAKAQYRTLFKQSRIVQGKLRLLTRQMILAQEQERKEISRELHDEVAQTLSGINVELAALSKGASVGIHALKEKIARTQRLVGKSVKMLHRFARDLRPAALDDLGLIPALHAYNKTVAARKKIKIRLTAFGGVEALGSNKRTVLYRVAQEALTNVARHAGASEVKMSIREMKGVIRMEICDNGKSFDVERAFSARNRTRLGLIGMRERVEMIGGILTIQSSVGHGTTVRVEIPFAPKRTRP